MRKHLRLCLTAAVLALPASIVASQVTLTPAEMRILASEAALKGQPDLAYDLAGALIERNEDDLDAHLIRSRAARDLGMYGEARNHARIAWKLADTDRTRYSAALANAQALASADRRTSAQWWLRRAAEIAPNDALKAQAARDFQFVRARNPWSTSFAFSIAPSSNINNGSRNDTSELFDLPLEFELQGAARALSGVEIATGLSTRYRLQQSQAYRTDLFFGLSHRTYTLSDDAKDIAPDVEGSDFAITSAFAGLQQTYHLPGANTQIGWNGRFGKTTYGGDPLLKYHRFGVDARRLFGQRTILDASLTREDQNGLEGRDDATIWSGQLGFGRALASGDRISMSATLTQSESDADYLDYDQREIAARYTMSKPVGPALLEFGLSASEKTHDRSSVSSDGREEQRLQATVTAALPEMDFYGFIPTVTFKASRTNANIDLYEAEEFGLQVGIRSAF